MLLDFKIMHYREKIRHKSQSFLISFQSFRPSIFGFTTYVPNLAQSLVENVWKYFEEHSSSLD